VSMRAMAIPGYGPLDQLKPITLPEPKPGADEVLIRVHASALNPAYYKVILGKVKFLHARNFPMVLGYDFSGVIESLGQNVANYKIGDEVFGFLPYSLTNRKGAFAELVTAKAVEIGLKPPTVSHIQAAAAATPGATVLQSLVNLGEIQKGYSVLITGASGGVGSLGIWIATKLGASVTAVGSGPGLELAKKLGAVVTLDRKTTNPLTSGLGPFDIVFDAAAAHRWKHARRLLKPGGAYVTTLPSLQFAADKLVSLCSRTRVSIVLVKSRPSDLQQLSAWLSTGLEVPIDSVIAVKDVAAGLNRLMNGNSLGRIAVQVHNGF
jgi:NADPH:quinone reductase